VAALCGCAFVVNGFFVKHFGQPSFLAAASWIPWVLVATLDVLTRPGRGTTSRLALAGAGSFLAGQPQIALHTAYAAALVALVTRWRRAAAPMRTVLVALAGASALALLLVGAQLLPTMELAARSARADLPWSTVASGAFHAVDAIRFAVEEFFGTPLTGDEWASLFPKADGFYLRTQLNSFFVGTPLFLLAILGMCGARTRSAALPFTVLFIVAGLLAFATPLARLAHATLPGFAFARLDRVGALLVVAQIVPAGLAASELATSRGREMRRWAIGVFVLAVVGTAAVGVVGQALPARLGAADAPAVLDPAILARTLPRVAMAAAFAVCTAATWWALPGRAASLVPIGLAIVQLVLFAAPYRADRRPEQVFAPSPGIERLRAALDADARHGGGRFMRFGKDLPVRPFPTSSVLPPSTNVPYRLRDLQGYNALADRSLGEALERATGEPLFSFGIWTGRRIVEPERGRSLEHPLLDALAVRAVVGAELPIAYGWTEVPCEGFRLAVNDEFLPRVRLVERGRGVSQDEMNAILSSGRMEPHVEALWVGEGSIDADVPAGNPGEIEILEDSWNRVRVRALSHAEAILVVADSYDTNWRVTIDGEAAPLLRVWGVVRGVRLPAGSHLVDMSYRPRSLVVGAGATGAGLLGLAALWGAGRRRRGHAPPVDGTL
jgi:hypothetical protein